MSIRLLAACLIALAIQILPTQADTIRWARSGDAVTLDPHASADSTSMQLNRNIYEPLVEREADGRLSTKLASSWLAKAGDPYVWIFNLRTNAQFHDGSALTAEDVVFSFKRAQSAGAALASRIADVVGVTAVDEATVEIRFSAKMPVMPAGISDILIMDKGWADKNDVATVKQPGEGNESFSTRNANGTGPYRLESRDPDVRTALIANETYWGVAPSPVGKIIYLPIENPAMLAAALLWGEIDVLQDMSLSDIEQISAANGLKVEMTGANEILYLGFGFGSKDSVSSDGAPKNPFDNRKLRRAIDLALDREDIAAFIDRGYAKSTSMLATPFVDGWAAGRAMPSQPDREMAEALLSDAGYPDGFAVKLDVALGDVAAANHIASMLASVGISTDIVARTHEAHLAYIAAGSSQMYLGDYAAPDYDSAAIFDWLVNEHPGYENAGLSAEIAGLSDISGPAERRAAITALWTTIQGEHIALPIAQRVIAHAMRQEISIPVDPNNQTRFETIRIGD